MKCEIFVGIFLSALLAAALGARVSAAPQQLSCRPLDPEAPAAEVLAFPLIVMARVETRSDGALELVPEFYLRGPALGGPLLLVPEEGECPPAALEPDARILAGLEPAPGGWRWPAEGQVFVIRNGVARSGDGRTISEEELVAALRRTTGQLAYPGTPEPGRTFDWLGVGLPVGVALAAIFAVGLYLMRLWHRIDPT